MAAHFHPSLRRASLHAERRKKQHKRVKLELVLFSALVAIFTLTRVIWKYEFPETYLGAVEHATLVLEIASFFE